MPSVPEVGQRVRLIHLAGNGEYTGAVHALGWKRPDGRQTVTVAVDVFPPGEPPRQKLISGTVWYPECPEVVRGSEWQICWPDTSPPNPIPQPKTRFPGLVSALRETLEERA